MVEIYIHFLADQKKWITIDLLGAQVNKIVDHSDVVGASPVGAAPTTPLFST